MKSDYLVDVRLVKFVVRCTFQPGKAVFAIGLQLLADRAIPGVPASSLVVNSATA